MVVLEFKGNYIIMKTCGYQGKRNDTIHLFSPFIFTAEDSFWKQKLLKKIKTLPGNSTLRRI